VALLGSLCFVSLSCGSDDVAIPTEPAGTIDITQVTVPVPLVEGSRILLDTRGISPDGGMLSLQFGTTEVPLLFILPEVATEAIGSTRVFELTRPAIDTLGQGEVGLLLTLNQGQDRSHEVPKLVQVSKRLDVSLTEGTSGVANREDSVILRGDGFLAGSEGILEATLVGTFVRTTGESEEIFLTVPVILAEALDRTRGTLRLTTDLGGIFPGNFEGTVSLRSTMRNGYQSTSDPLVMTLNIQPPTVFGFTPNSASLGQIITVDGAGLLGLGDRPDEVTLLRFDGRILGVDGSDEPFVGKEVVLSEVTGREGRLALDITVTGKKLKSTFFSLAVGQFVGTVTPLVIKGADEFAGDPVPLDFRLNGVKQIAVVSFLSGFYDSLHLFGLALAREQVEQSVLARMRSIYDGYAIDFMTDRPDNFLPVAVATIELGGPDPNGYGVFGYDNTPGKDVGNVRLFDSIGGENADLQADGEPGYGGVFIESFLWWSSHPDLPGTRPAGAPDVDPLFDAIFDPVRNAPATLAEAQGQSDGARAEQVARAIRALSSMVGETSSHEFGHSLGMAQPYGLKSAFHSANPDDGCLMDGGAWRPLGERAAEPDFAETRFCGDEVTYLTEILPIQEVSL
jgi:hypothetical protein